MNRRYIIWAPPFDEKDGGAIVLHKLCDAINEVGGQAFIWPSQKPGLSLDRPLASLWRAALYILRRVCGFFPALGRLRFLRSSPLSRLFTYKFVQHEEFNTPIATYKKLHGAIVVYPEIVSGNPLGVKRVVRWLLHKPGFHTGKKEYGRDDLFFYFQKSFDDPRWNKSPENILRIVWVRDDIYRQWNYSKRAGKCFLIKKGEERPIKHDLADGIIIDDLSHEECAQAFNQCEYFISYDLYSMYSVYAAICGCISVVVPDDGMTKTDWRPEPHRRYGIAYGENDIESASTTRELLIREFEKGKKQNIETVRKFMQKTQMRFE
ncbi:MAG: hypothetical protein KJP16_11275 [Gammaproteobacteria bacterium]|nr:hypothetical protein [Gammaproteobacteria bacterium]NNL51389.1 hypothetical protein [Woeseiaceae bacterium]